MLAMVILAVTDLGNRAGSAGRIRSGFHRLGGRRVDFGHRPVDTGMFQPRSRFWPRLFAFFAGWGSECVA